MKVKDLIRGPKLMNEGTRMSPASFGATLDDQNIMCGFEAEWYSESVDVGSIKGADINHNHPKWDQDRVDSWLDGVEEDERDSGDIYFAEYRSDAWHEVQSEAEAEHADDEDWEFDYNDYEDEIEERAIKMARENFVLDRDEYMSQHMDELYQILNITQSTEDDFHDLKDRIEEECGITIGEACVGYDCADKDYKTYALETDGDGPELVSPVQPLRKTLEDIKAVLNFISSDGFATSGNGLHVGMSLKDKTKYDYDLFKLALFLGEEHVQDTFGRKDNSYARAQLPRLKVLIKSIYKKFRGEGHQGDLFGISRGELIQALMNLHKDQDLRVDYVTYLADANVSDKYRTFNIQKLMSDSNPYIEFRIMGNANYQERYDEIEATILRYAYVMQLATNPDLERQEYIKKLSVLVDGVIASMQEERKGSAYQSRINKWIRGTIESPAFDPLMRKEFSNNRNAPTMLAAFANLVYRNMGADANEAEEANDVSALYSGGVHQILFFLSIVDPKTYDLAKPHLQMALNKLKSKYKKLNTLDSSTSINASIHVSAESFGSDRSFINDLPELKKLGITTQGELEEYFHKALRGVLT